MARMERNRRGRPRHPDVLTPAEWRVLEQLRQGGTNAEIGARLGITADAVKFHISNMLGKLGLQGRHELAAWRPEERRGRLGALFGVPAAVASVAKPVAWVGAGAAAVAGVVVAAVAAVAVVAVVLVGVGGNGDLPAVVKSPELTTGVPTTPTPSATPQSEVTLTYNLLDATGAATTPGSYAFLETAGDPASAIGNFGSSAWFGVELRIHRSDASGTARDALFDSILVGDMFDYQTSRLHCGFRFKVTSVASAASLWTFGIERTTQYGGSCPGFVDEPTAARDVHFVWKTRAGIANGENRPRLLLHDEPTGHGTYRLVRDAPWIIDVPADGQVSLFGVSMGHSPTGDTTSGVRIEDPETGSRLFIDLDTGRETRRVATSPEADALFDKIMASIRHEH